MPALSDGLRLHWPEYLMEAAGLGLFMISAAVVTTALEYPHSPLHDLWPDPTLRRILIGLAMGLTGREYGVRNQFQNPALLITCSAL